MKNEENNDLISEMIEIEDFIYERLNMSMAFLLSYSLNMQEIGDADLDSVILPSSTVNALAIVPLLKNAIKEPDVLNEALSYSDVIPADLILAYSYAGEKLTDELPEDESHAAGTFLNNIYLALATISWTDEIVDNSIEYGIESYDVSNDRSGYTFSDLIKKEVTVDDFKDILEMSDALFFEDDEDEDEEGAKMKEKISGLLHRLEEEV